MIRKANNRAEVLENGPMHYAPQNEQGVVFLFAHHAKKLRMRVDEIRQGFPDCIAYEKTSRGERPVRIEFELYSSSFKSHKHPSRACDCIVCWEHDWPDCPKSLRIIELRKYYGLGFKVWLQPANAPQQHYLDNNTMNWATRQSAHRGDLMVMYRCAPEKCIREIFFLSTDITKEKCDPVWRIGTCFGGIFKIVCRLEAPIFLKDLRDHRVLRTAGFIRGRLQGNQDITQYWPHLYELIVSRNPKARLSVKKYSPERLDIR
jgi:hypothetical protein